jgi:hypothetical protein
MSTFSKKPSFRKFQRTAGVKGRIQPVIGAAIFLKFDRRVLADSELSLCFY